MEEDGYFVTSLPMSRGYHAYVDGKKTKPETVNQTFVGFPLKKGRMKSPCPSMRPVKFLAVYAVVLPFSILQDQALFPCFSCLVIRMASSTGLS